MKVSLHRNIGAHECSDTAQCEYRDTRKPFYVGRWRIPNHQVVIFMLRPSRSDRRLIFMKQPAAAWTPSGMLVSLHKRIDALCVSKIAVHFVAIFVVIYASVSKSAQHHGTFPVQSLQWHIRQIQLHPTDGRNNWNMHDPHFYQDPEHHRIYPKQDDINAWPFCSTNSFHIRITFGIAQLANSVDRLPEASLPKACRQGFPTCLDLPRLA